MLHAHLCHAPCKIALQGACHSAARRMAQCCKAHATVLQGACHSAARRMPQCCKGHSTLFFPHALHAPGPAWTVDVCGKKGGTLNMGCSSRVFWANGRGQPPSLATASERATERATEGHREGSQRGLTVRAEAVSIAPLGEHYPGRLVRPATQAALHLSTLVERI